MAPLAQSSHKSSCTLTCRLLGLLLFAAPQLCSAETSHYDVLEIHWTADAKQIRRAYHRLALGCHPDRFPDDPEAHTKFVRLSSSYMVLADESSRRQYDVERLIESVELFSLRKALWTFVASLGLDGLLTAEGKPDWHKIREITRAHAIMIKAAGDNAMVRVKEAAGKAWQRTKRFGPWSDKPLLLKGCDCEEAKRAWQRSLVVGIGTSATALAVAMVPGVGQAAALGSVLSASEFMAAGVLGGGALLGTTTLIDADRQNAMDCDC